MADWQFGGNAIYQNMSAREKLIVLQRDQTFMKDTTTWQEEYQRQQLLAATEEDEKQETDPVKTWEDIMGKDAAGFGDVTPSLYDRGLPLGIRDGKAFGGNAEGVQKLLMAMGRQNQTKFLNDQQRDRFENILYGSVETKDTGYDEFGMYIKGADGERYNLPEGKTITIEGHEMPLEVWQNIKRAKKQKGLAFTAEFIRSQMALLGQGMPIGTQQALLEAGIGGAAELAIQQAEAYNETIYKTKDDRGMFIDMKAPAQFQAAQGRAEAMGRATWYKEQAKDSAFQTGGENVRYWVEQATGGQLTAEDNAAIKSLQSSHNAQVKTEADKAFQTGRKVNLLWLRRQTINNAKALGQSIANRLSQERQTASDFGSIIGISQTEALQILRDKSQGEQTLIDMLTYQQRLDAMSSGVIS